MEMSYINPIVMITIIFPRSLFTDKFFILLALTDTQKIFQSFVMSVWGNFFLQVFSFYPSSPSFSVWG